MGRRVLWEGAQDIVIEESVRLMRREAQAEEADSRDCSIDWTTAFDCAVAMTPRRLGVDADGDARPALDVAALPGFVAEDDGEWLGYATYELRDGELEIAVLEAQRPGQGVGSALLAAASTRPPNATVRRASG